MSATVQVHATDPAPRLEAAFARIERECMSGLPLLNPALRVQALDFTRWQGHWLGALVTPWFLNLVLVPGNAASWRTAGEGERVFHHFGAGDFAFLGNDEPEVGEFQSCSLVSPMGQFPDQDHAGATARAALRMLHVEQPAAALVGAAAQAASGALEVPNRRIVLFGRHGRARPAPAD